MAKTQIAKDGWTEFSTNIKLSILEGESLVMASLLMENDEFVALFRGGASKERCLKFINENW